MTTNLEITNDNKYLIASFMDPHLRIWNLDDLESPPIKVKTETHYISDMIISKSSEYLITNEGNKRIKLRILKNLDLSQNKLK